MFVLFGRLGKIERVALKIGLFAKNICAVLCFGHPEVSSILPWLNCTILFPDLFSL